MILSKENRRLPVPLLYLRNGLSDTVFKAEELDVNNMVLPNVSDAKGGKFFFIWLKPSLTQCSRIGIVN